MCVTLVQCNYFFSASLAFSFFFFVFLSPRFHCAHFCRITLYPAPPSLSCLLRITCKWSLFHFDPCDFISLRFLSRWSTCTFLWFDCRSIGEAHASGQMVNARGRQSTEWQRSSKTLYTSDYSRWQVFLWRRNKRTHTDISYYFVQSNNGHSVISSCGRKRTLTSIRSLKRMLQSFRNEWDTLVQVARGRKKKEERVTEESKIY